jgi:fumarate hydratase class I
METIQDNIRLARENSTPICQDTGTLLFYIHYPEGWSPRLLRQQVVETVVEATKLNYLRPNTVNAITGKNTGNNLGDEFHPTTHFEEVLGDELTIDLILKGGGCENVGCQYRLPEARVGASRDLDGVRKVVLDAVHQAQGKGCAPGILGVAIGGDRGSSYLASKEVFLRKMDEENSIPELADLEARITEEANQLGIGPMGFGGKTSLLKTMIKGMHRIPACYFVSVSYMCWAYRRRRMIIKNDHVIYQ